MSKFIKLWDYNAIVVPVTQSFGTAETQGFSYIGVSCFCSSDFSVQVNWSMDRVNTDIVDSSGIITGGNTYYASFPVKARYVSISFTDQTAVGNRAIRLQGYLNFSGLSLTALKSLGAGVPIYDVTQQGIKSLLSGPGIDISSTTSDITIGSTHYQGSTAITPIEATSSCIACGTGTNSIVPTRGFMAAVVDCDILGGSDSVIIASTNCTTDDDSQQAIIGCVDCHVDDMQMGGIYSSNNCDILVSQNSGRCAIMACDNCSMTNPLNNNMAYNVMIGAQGGNIIDGNLNFLTGKGTINGVSGCFLASDNSTGNMTITTAQSYTTRYSGGYALFSSSGAVPTTGVILAPGSSSWASVCDRNKKENLVLLNSSDIMDRISQLPLYKYNYIGNPSQCKNMGPMAQDWHDLFPCEQCTRETEIVEPDGSITIEKKTGPAKDQLSIETMDLIGSLLACVQDLNARVKELESLN